MKVRIVKDERYSPEEKEEMIEEARNPEESPETLAEFREKTKDVKEVVIPESVKKKLDELGISVDEVVAMLAKQMGKQQ